MRSTRCGGWLRSWLVMDTPNPALVVGRVRHGTPVRWPEAVPKTRIETRTYWTAARQGGPVPGHGQAPKVSFISRRGRETEGGRRGSSSWPWPTCSVREWVGRAGAAVALAGTLGREMRRGGPGWDGTFRPGSIQRCSSLFQFFGCGFAFLLWPLNPSRSRVDTGVERGELLGMEGEMRVSFLHQNSPPTRAGSFYFMVFWRKRRGGGGERGTLLLLSGRFRRNEVEGALCLNGRP